jgi:hypothetical protein
MRTPALSAALAIVAAAAAGCSQPATANRVCTMIGCESGLTVIVEAAPQGPYRVEARAAGEEPRVRECQSEQDCRRIFFADFLPEEVILEVIAGDARSSHTVRPQVVTVQPNGPECPPTCRQARVTVP